MNNQIQTLADVAFLLGWKPVEIPKLLPCISLALHPPKGVNNPLKWEDVVLRGKHTTYGGAVAHYNASLAKWGR